MSSRWWRPGATAAVAVAAALGAAPALGSIVLAMDLPTLTARADRIVVGEVTAVKSGWDSRHQRILSTVDVQVSEVWKGQAPGDGHLRLVQPGGSADGVEMRVLGLPAFVPGERAVLFLRGAANQPLALVGMGQGKRGLRFDQAQKRWMVDGGDRSAAVNRDTNGRLLAAPAEAALPLDEMRRVVRGLVARP